MKNTYSVAIFLMVLGAIATGIIITTIPSDTNLIQPETSQLDYEKYDIPVHVYEIWNSQGIIIHGNVDKQDDSSTVEIQITDDKGNIIEIVNILPDDAGRFVYSTTKFIPYVAEINPKWENVQSYNVSAYYKHPFVLDENLKDVSLEKNKIPLTKQQISGLSYEQIIQIIKNWNDVGGNSPFEVLSIVGLQDTYNLGEPIQFQIQKSGYGKPCPNQGIIIFDEDIKEQVRTQFYMEFCGADENIPKPYDYLMPYNDGMFGIISPITEPGNYLVVARSDNNSKHTQQFTILDSGHTFERKLVYSMQRDSTSNKRTMEIDLTTGEMTIENPENRETTKASLDSGTLEKLNREIKNHHLLSNPFTNQVYGELCDTCNLGQIELYIDDVMAHHIIWDDKSLENPLSETSPGGAEFFVYFDMVDCIASKNNFDTYWISDSAASGKNYSDSTQTCDELVKESSGLDSFFPGQNADYDVLVNDKPRRNVPEGAGNIGGTHIHASILVKIFGDRFDFSKTDYQIKNAYIHFEGQDGDTIHMHATGVPLEFLFKTMNIGIRDECFVFPDGREFCTNDEYSLKFYVNGDQVDSVAKYVISQNDRILISYGPESEEQIKEEVAELDLQMIIG